MHPEGGIAKAPVLADVLGRRMWIAGRQPQSEAVSSYVRIESEQKERRVPEELRQKAEGYNNNVSRR